MTEHTKEPWHAPGLGEIHAENHDEIAQILFHHEDDDGYCGTEEDARRIVACVNACAGLSTENLEKLVASGHTLQIGFGQALHANASSPQPAVTQPESNLPKG